MIFFLIIYSNFLLSHLIIVTRVMQQFEIPQANLVSFLYCIKKQNAAFSYQMIPLCLAIACGLSKRSKISYLEQINGEIFREPRGMGLFVFQVLVNISFSFLTMSLYSLVWFHGSTKHTRIQQNKELLRDQESMVKKSKEYDTFLCSSNVHFFVSLSPTKCMC